MIFIAIWAFSNVGASSLLEYYLIDVTCGGGTSRYLPVM